MSREAFLNRVRDAAVRGQAYRVTTQSLPDRVGYVGAGSDLCDCLAAEIVAVGGEAFVADDLLAARAIVAQLCLEAGATSALCWEHELLERLGLTELLTSLNIQRVARRELDSLDAKEQRLRALSAGIGITSCELAVAETGSLLMCARPGRERMASLLPPLHVAVVERAQILPDLYDAIAHLQSLGSKGLPSNAVFITGPSKTGDMELELTTGVHGPGRWCVVVVK